MLASAANSAETSEAVPAGTANWTPEQQIAHMLDLCEAQMESALHESDEAVDSLIKSFTALFDSARAMTELAAKLPPELKATLGTNIDQQCEQITKQMASAIVAFQFYDKLTQRLGHVRYSLSTMAMFVCDKTQSQQRDQWGRLFTALRRLYRTDEEREIFRLMTEGCSADEAKAKAQALARPANLSNSSNIELF